MTRARDPGAGLPDRKAALESYREHAPWYDHQTDWAAPDRERVVELLALEPGDVVLDVGCGTGLCFPLVLERVGPTGQLVAIEQCIDMLVHAQERVDESRWTNVDLVLGSAEDVSIPVVADAALLCFTHDVLRTPRALQNIVAHVRPGGRIAAVGPMWAPWWAPAMNLMIWYVASQYVTTFEGFSAPWSHLARFVPELVVEPQELAGVFFAWGTRPEENKGQTC